MAEAIAPWLSAAALAVATATALDCMCLHGFRLAGAAAGSDPSPSPPRSVEGTRVRGRKLEQQYTGDGLQESGSPTAAAAGPSDVDASRFIDATKATTIKVVVLGGGNFGTAMAYAASRNGHEVVIWMRDASQARYFNETHKNPKVSSQHSVCCL